MPRGPSISSDDLIFALVYALPVIAQGPRRSGSVITYQICGVLSRVHDQGIIHRDLKPENIVLKDQYPPTGGWRRRWVPRQSPRRSAEPRAGSGRSRRVPHTGRVLECGQQLDVIVFAVPTEHIITITRQVQWMLLCEWDVSEQAETFIRVPLASSQSERMSLTSALLATSAEREGAPQPLPTTPPVLHTASLQALPSAPSIADRAHLAARFPADGPAKTAQDGAAAGSCTSLDGPSLTFVMHPPSPERAVTLVRDSHTNDGVRDGYVLSSPWSAPSEGSRRGRLQRRSKVPSRAGAAGGRGVPGAVAGHACVGGGGSGWGPVEEPEPHAMKEATPARENGTLKDDTPVRKAAEKRKRGSRRTLIKGGSPHVAKRLGTELSMSVAEVEGTE
ncbi:uncharacterized protein BXZ73DRAFT_109117 [Epithele typhae]|uniref:uncharacterized protein n=1 Tax=Epithele typhae TaxID=378194 RepID=UPI002007269E|nr:uncharacterized protein BXZ73DRAFT_109117 [Epithele typhae]KAH9910353.1 hypothetical protein BXZ73DRAFT_109117 [Epithele typhae]